MNKKLFFLLFLVPLIINSCKKEPEACFTYEPEEIYIYDTVKFYNCSTNAVRYTWQFGDDSTSSEENPIHVYKEIITIPTVYTVILVAGNSSVSDITSQEITVHHIGEIFEGSYTGIKRFYEKNYLISQDTIVINAEMSPADMMLYWKNLSDDVASGEAISKQNFNIQFDSENIIFSGNGYLSVDSLHIRTYSDDSIYRITFDGVRL